MELSTVFPRSESIDILFRRQEMGASYLRFPIRIAEPSGERIGPNRKIFFPMVGISLILVLLLALVGSAIAQSTVGTIVGTVTDPSGAVLVGVKVTVTNTATSIARTVSSDETGNYSLLRLLPGTYSIN